jgi:hypothetical protein
VGWSQQTTSVSHFSLVDEVTLGYLKGTGQDIVELILLLCRRGATFDDLMQVMPFLSSPELLKKYLFYLIDYDLISLSR